MPFTHTDIEQVAQLARLQLSPQEKNRYPDQLSAVLGYVNMLHGLEAVNVSPSTHTLLLQQVLRPDDSTSI